MSYLAESFKSNSDSQKPQKNKKETIIASFAALVKKTQQEAEAICELTEVENNINLSLIISKNIAQTGFNIYRARLAIGYSFPDNWKDISIIDAKETRRKDELELAENSIKNKAAYSDIQDMMASEAMPLIKFSEKLVAQSKEILSLVEKLDLDNKTKKQMSDMTYTAGSSIIVFSERLVEKKG